MLESLYNMSFWKMSNKETSLQAIMVMACNEANKTLIADQWQKN